MIHFSYVNGFRKRLPALFYSIIFVWTFGLMAGALFASSTELDYRFWMCAIQSSRVSILSLLILMFLPFILSWFAIRFAQPWIFFLLALIKSFIYSYWRCLIIKLFFSAGWVVNILFFLPDNLCTLLLIFYWLYGLFRLGQWTHLALLLCILLSGIIIFSYCCFVAPVLMTLLV